MNCPHTKAIKEYHSDTTYGVSDYSYWSKNYCPECGKWWKVYSNDIEYRMYREVKSIKKWRKENEL